MKALGCPGIQRTGSRKDGGGRGVVATSYASHHHISHHTTFYTTVSRTAFRILHQCMIRPHLTVITPSSTSQHHVSHNIPHHTSVHHHILHPTTYHISRNTTSTTTYCAVSQPTLYLIPHRTKFYIPCHSPHATSFLIAHTPIHITPPLFVTRFQFERLELSISVILLKTRPAFPMK